MKILIYLTILAAVVLTVCGHPALDVPNGIETLEGVNGNVGVDADKNAETLVRSSRSFCCGGGGGYRGGRGYGRPYGGGRGGYGRPFYGGGGGGGSFSSSYSQSSAGSISGGFGK